MNHVKSIPKTIAKTSRLLFCKAVSDMQHEYRSTFQTTLALSMVLGVYTRHRHPNETR
jgi:hypothetical protein